MIECRITDAINDPHYEVRPRKDKRGADLISDVLPFGRLWCGGPNATSNAVDYAKFYRRAHSAVIRVYDAAGNVIEMHEHKGDFKRVVRLATPKQKPACGETRRLIASVSLTRFSDCSEPFAVHARSVQAARSLSGCALFAPSFPFREPRSFSLVPERFDAL